MAGKKEIYDLLRSFSLRKRSHELPMSELLAYAGRYIEQRSRKQPDLRELSGDTALKITTYLEELAADGRCRLDYREGKIATIDFPAFFVEHIRKQYAEIEENADLPFPTEQSLGYVIPSDCIVPIDVKNEFVAALEENRFESTQIVRLVYPEDITAVVAISDMLESELMKLSLHKVRQYLSIQKNAFYMVSKLRSVFRTKEQIVKDMINSVLTQRQQAIESLVHPTDFSFSFWTHLANAILKEFRDKSNKLEREHTFCQAAYLIGFYAVRYKSVRRKERETAAAFKTLEKKLHSEPYVFTVSDIAGFTDEQGIPLTRKYTRSELHAYLERKTRSASPDALPEIVRLRTSSGRQEYFVCKEVVLPLALKKIHDASGEFNGHYEKVFMKAIDELTKLPEMKSDQAFLTDVEKRLKSEAPLLSSLLSYELLFLLLQEQKPGQEVSDEISRILDSQHQKLIQTDELLGLSRRELVNRAKMRLPFWKSVPVLNRLIGLLGRLASGRQAPGRRAKKTAKSRRSFPGASEASAEPAAPSTKVLGGHPGTAISDASPGAQRGKPGGPAALQKAMSKLKLEFVGTASITDSMDELIEKWNPLFDPQAKANLVEDVNSLIRDFLRKLKRSFLVKPPDAERIRTMATSLAENKAFEKIKRKDYLTRYIELYMIKVLGGK